MTEILHGLRDSPVAVAALATVGFFLLYAIALPRRRLSTVVFIGIVFELIFVVLHFTPRLNNIVILKDVACQVITFTLFLLWLSFLPVENGFELTPSPMNIAVFVYFAAVVVTAYAAPVDFWYYALEWSARFGALVLMFFLIVRFVDTRRRWFVVIHTILALVALTSLYGLMQNHGYDFMNWGRIVNVSTFGNKSFFASFLVYTVPIALWMAVGAERLWDFLIYFVVAALGCYHLLTLESRNAWVGMMTLVAAAIFFECVFGRMRRRFGDWKQCLLVCIAVAVLTIWSAASFMSPHRVETFKSIFQFDQGINVIKLYMGWTGANMLWDSPLLGQGLGTSHVIIPFFRPDRYHRIGMSHNTDYVHSEELQCMAEQGILGLAAWLAVILIFFYICYRKLKTMERLTDRYMLFGLVAGILGGVVASTTDVAIRWSTSLITSWTVLALGTRYVVGFDEEIVRTVSAESSPTIEQSGNVAVQAVEEIHNGNTFRRWALFPILAAVFAFMVYGEYRVVRADWSLKAAEESDGAVAIDKGIETLKYNPFSHSAYYKLAFLYLNANRIPDALDVYNNLLRVAPNYAQTHQNTGLIYYRMFGNTNDRKCLYQSILEFEWATILENNIENHTKLLQLYSHFLNDTARGRYHNQFLIWNAGEDEFFAWSRFWRSISASVSPPSKKDVAAMYKEWVEDIDDSTGESWIYRTDALRRVGRPWDEIRYALKMSTRCVPNNVNLLTYALSTILTASPPSDEDLMYLISITEQSDSGQSASCLAQARDTLRQKLGGTPPPPLLAYALGVLSYKIGDVAGARDYFRQAEPGRGRYRVIRDGMGKYKI